MPASRSESYLLQLAERTFLKVWAIPGPAYKLGKELTDLIVPFGDDVIIVSDKACVFDPTLEPALAWSRWSRAALDESLKQLGGALRRLQMEQTQVYTDLGGRHRLAFELAPPDRRRYHLIAVARPDRDPAVLPEGWPGLTYDDAETPGPFALGRQSVHGRFVHLLDGASIDLLLQKLDTAPDLIAYLTAREATLSAGGGFRFREADLLAHATLNWMNGLGYSIDGPGPALSAEIAGLWDMHTLSSRAQATEEKNRPSRLIDDMIEDFHRAYLDALATPAGHPNAGFHEQAMRLLARESRFDRRILADALFELRNDPDQGLIQALTLSTRTTPGTRYVLVTFPPLPAGVTPEMADRWYLTALSEHIIVAADHFGDPLVIGPGINNRVNDDPVRLVRMLDATTLTEEDRQWAAEARGRGVFVDLHPHQTIHVP